MEYCRKMAYSKGYVQTIWGRKRRFPILKFPPYEVFYVNGVKADKNAHFKVEQLMRNVWKREEKEELIAKFLTQGLRVIDNTGYIAKAKRQFVNSVVQGSAADQIKISMNVIHRDEQLRALGFRLLLQVHDELIGECPIENKDACEQRFKYLMLNATGYLRVPNKCDMVISDFWEDG